MISFIADFTMSDVQRIHISTVEQLVPNISALKIKLQSLISNERFWMIYFILLVPRFNERDFELLATPEVRLISLFKLPYSALSCLLFVMSNALLLHQSLIGITWIIYNFKSVKLILELSILCLIGLNAKKCQIDA